MAQMNVDDPHLLVCRLQVELELAINTTSANYAHSKGEQIALNVDGKDNGPDSNAMYRRYSLISVFTYRVLKNIRSFRRNHLIQNGSARRPEIPTTFLADKFAKVVCMMLFPSAL